MNKKWSLFVYVFRCTNLTWYDISKHSKHIEHHEIPEYEPDIQWSSSVLVSPENRFRFETFRRLTFSVVDNLIHWKFVGRSVQDFSTNICAEFQCDRRRVWDGSCIVVVHNLVTTVFSENRFDFEKFRRSAPVFAIRLWVYPIPPPHTRARRGRETAVVRNATATG